MTELVLADSLQQIKGPNELVLADSLQGPRGPNELVADSLQQENETPLRDAVCDRHSTLKLQATSSVQIRVTLLRDAVCDRHSTPKSRMLGTRYRAIDISPSSCKKWTGPIYGTSPCSQTYRTHLQDESVFPDTPLGRVRGNDLGPTRVGFCHTNSLYIHA